MAQSGRIPRVGYLFSFPRGEGEHLWQACRTGLRELGYVEGQNVTVVPRWADGDYQRLPALVKELLALKVDVLVTAATPPSRAEKRRGNPPEVCDRIAPLLRAAQVRRQ